jgi:hypothetical protein
MKYLLTLVLALSLFCIKLSAQQINQRVKDEKSQTDILVGSCNLEGLLSTEFAASYDEMYKGYQPSDEIIALLKNSIEGINFTIVLGTWCGDSKEQVPRFLKILDILAYPYDQLKMIAVDRDKSTPEMNVKEDYKIEKVPTFIVYRGNTEIGRIIETPAETLEKDLLEIVVSK